MNSVPKRIWVDAHVMRNDVLSGRVYGTCYFGNAKHHGEEVEYIRADLCEVPDDVLEVIEWMMTDRRSFHMYKDRLKSVRDWLNSQHRPEADDA